MSKLDEYRAMRDRAREVYERSQTVYETAAYRLGEKPEADDKRERMERLEKAYQGMSGGSLGSIEGRERWYDKEGQEIRVLGPSDRMGAGADTAGLNMQRFVRGLVTGNWKGADMERAAMGEGSIGAGGAMVPTPLAGFFIDKVRNALVLSRAGARTVPMESETLKIARLLTDPTPAWKAENAAFTETDLTMDQVTLTARTLVAGVRLSYELLADAPNGQEIITGALAAVMARELDRAGLLGDGTANSPTGIYHASGVNIDTTTFGTNGSAISGTTPTGAVAYDWLSKAVFARQAVNEQPNAVVYNSRTAGELDLLRASTGEPLQLPYGVAAIQRLVSNVIPINLTQGTSSTASIAILGDYNQCLVGMRNDVVFETSREATGSGGSSWQQLQFAIRVYLRADIQIARPAAFNVTAGIL